jgi:hypothetical protein
LAQAAEICGCDPATIRRRVALAHHDLTIDPSRSISFDVAGINSAAGRDPGVACAARTFGRRSRSKSPRGDHESAMRGGPRKTRCTSVH